MKKLFLKGGYHESYRPFHPCIASILTPVLINRAPIYILNFLNSDYSDGHAFVLFLGKKVRTSRPSFFYIKLTLFFQLMKKMYDMKKTIFTDSGKILFSPKTVE